MEHLDVLVVGAGLSGIGAGHYIQTDCPWASYAIFEARDSIGGTWDLFKYPGLRSDSDMYTLGYPFRPWEGKKSIADGADILAYIKETARVEGIDRNIRFNHRIIRAEWSTADARWLVTAERTDTGESIELTAGFVFFCSGYYRYDQGYLPEWDGFADFKGTVVHPQHWDTELDYTGKRVVVIGSGATAITLIPSMADRAGHVTMLQRSPTYIGSQPAVDHIARALQKVLPTHISGPIIKWYKAIFTQGFYRISQDRPELVKKVLRRMLERQLPKGYDIDLHFTPSYNPWDQRFCVAANGDLFKAISKGTASVVTDHIDHFSEKGIVLRSGSELEADIVVTATGLEMLFIGGVELVVDGEKVNLPERFAYKGMMLEGVPNMGVAVGYTNASWTLKCDLTCQYVTRLVNHMHTTGDRQCTPINEGTDLEQQPLLGLSSGYVTRAADRFPKSGTRYPWQVYQSYLKDYRALKRAGIHDDAMRFTNPAPATRPEAVAS